jgi:hypothetical protein
MTALILALSPLVMPQGKLPGINDLRVSESISFKSEIVVRRYPNAAAEKAELEANERQLRKVGAERRWSALELQTALEDMRARLQGGPTTEKSSADVFLDSGKVLILERVQPQPGFGPVLWRTRIYDGKDTCTVFEPFVVRASGFRMSNIAPFPLLGGSISSYPTIKIKSVRKRGDQFLISGDVLLINAVASKSSPLVYVAGGATAVEKDGRYHLTTMWNGDEATYYSKWYFEEPRAFEEGILPMRVRWVSSSYHIDKSMKPSREIIFNLSDVKFGKVAPEVFDLRKYTDGVTTVHESLEGKFVQYPFDPSKASFELMRSGQVATRGVRVFAQ